MKRIDEQDFLELRIGGTEPLTKIFEQNYLYCTNQIVLTTNCTLEDSKDLVMDAIIVLREKIMMQNFKNDNVQAFILKVAVNMWKNQQKRKRKLLPYDPRIVEAYLKKDNEDFVLDDDRQKQVDMTLYALKSLGEPCATIIRRSAIDRIPLRNLAEELGYKNKDVMKTTKARCVDKLKQSIAALVKNEENG